MRENSCPAAIPDVREGFSCFFPPRVFSTLLVFIDGKSLKYILSDGGEPQMTTIKKAPSTPHTVRAKKKRM